MKCCTHCDFRTVCCDFCRLYNFNGVINKGTGIELYTEEGYCTFHDEAKHPGDSCEDFICEHYKVKDKNRR